MEPLLEVEKVSAGYGAVCALRDVSLRVMPGEIVTILGSNGAGKSTTLRVVSGLVSAWEGAVRFAGQEITGAPAHALVSRGIAHVPEGRRIFPRLTVKENLLLGGYTRTDKREVARTIEEVCELFPILRDRSSQAGGTLSGGEQQMLAIARALVSKPRLLLMDEPSMGVAPKLVQRIFDTIVKLNKSGITILLVEQNAHLALEIASRGYVLETGSVALTDVASLLRSDPRVRDAYLGE